MPRVRLQFFFSILSLILFTLPLLSLIPSLILSQLPLLILSPILNFDLIITIRSLYIVFYYLHYHLLSLPHITVQFYFLYNYKQTLHKMTEPQPSNTHNSQQNNQQTHITYPPENAHSMVDVHQRTISSTIVSQLSETLIVTQHPNPPILPTQSPTPSNVQTHPNLSHVQTQSPTPPNIQTTNPNQINTVIIPTTDKNKNNTQIQPNTRQSNTQIPQFEKPTHFTQHNTSQQPQQYEKKWERIREPEMLKLQELMIQIGPYEIQYINVARQHTVFNLCRQVKDLTHIDPILRDSAFRNQHYKLTLNSDILNKLKEIKISGNANTNPYNRDF
eukprot:25071_1